MSFKLAVLGHSFLAEHHSLADETRRYLSNHPDFTDVYVAGISGLLYEGTDRLLRDMREACFEPDSIYLLSGDNNVCTREGRPRMGLDLEAFPAAFHDSRETAVALCEDVVGYGNCCSSLPFPRFKKKRGKLFFDPMSTHNRIAGNYIRMLPIYRPNCDLPCVPQRHRVPYILGRKLFPRKPTKTLFKRRDGIHPAPGKFDDLLRDSLDAWIARCIKFK